MKVKPIYWIALGLALALFFAVCDGLRTKDKYSVVVGQLEEAVKAKDVVIAEKDKVIAGANIVIAAKTKEVADILAQAGKPSPSEVEKDKAIAALKKKNAELAAAGDYKAAYEGAQAEIRAWSDKFTLAEERHAKDIFNLNASWQGKYDAQVEISDAWKAKYEAEHRVSMLAQDGLKLAVRKLKTTRIIGNASKLALVAVGGYVLIDKLKGSK